MTQQLLKCMSSLPALHISSHQTYRLAIFADFNGIEQKWARTILELNEELKINNVDHLLQRFLYQQENTDNLRDPADIPLDECPRYDRKIMVFNSAVATFYTPSDISGINGMRHEFIRSCPSWRQGHPRHDCAFITTDPELPGM